MADDGALPGGKGEARAERERRLAAALRRNLRRRKAAPGFAEAPAEASAGRDRPDGPAAKPAPKPPQ
jgi:hypothetical protein